MQVRDVAPLRRVGDRVGVDALGQQGLHRGGVEPHRLREVQHDLRVGAEVGAVVLDLVEDHRGLLVDRDGDAEARAGGVGHGPLKFIAKGPTPRSGMSDPVQVLAHRGLLDGPDHARENALPALREAAARGFGSSSTSAATTTAA